MGRLLARRLLSTLVLVLGVSVLVFSLTHLSGDPATLMLPAEASVEQIAEFRAKLGLSDPLTVQYFRFISRAFIGDFGTSLRHAEPAMELVLSHVPATLQLTTVAMLISLAVSIPLGVICAVYRRSIWDLIGQLVSLGGQATPNFWLAILLISVFAVQLHLLPTSGRGTWRHLILPAIAISARLIALFTRLTRSSLLDALGEDYIRTARAKGLSQRIVVFKHGLKNALIPLVTMIGLQFGYVLGGAVVIETVFSWPGVGYFTVQAIYNRDYPVVQAAVFFLALSIVFINLGVDWIYGWLDPRIRVDS